MIIHAARIDLPSSSETIDESKRIARWRVRSNNRYDGTTEPLRYSGIPKFNAPWELNGVEDPWFRVVDRTCVPDKESPFVTIVTNTYSDRLDIQDIENKSKELQPLDRTPKVSRRYVEIEEPLTKDQITDAIIRNTAGDQILGLKRKRIQVVYDLEGYFGVNPLWLELINGTINKFATVIYGRSWAAHQLKFNLQSISPLQFERGQYYYTVKATLIGDDNPWGHKLHTLNAGLREKDFFAGNKLVRCKINDTEVTHPVPLDAGGYMITPAALEADPINAPHYIDIARDKEADFAVIGLPPTTYQPDI